MMSRSAHYAMLLCINEQSSTAVNHMHTCVPVTPHWYCFILARKRPNKQHTGNMTKKGRPGLMTGRTYNNNAAALLATCKSTDYLSYGVEGGTMIANHAQKTGQPRAGCTAWNEEQPEPSHTTIASSPLPLPLVRLSHGSRCKTLASPRSSAVAESPRTAPSKDQGHNTPALPRY